MLRARVTTQHTRNRVVPGDGAAGRPRAGSRSRARARAVGRAANDGRRPASAKPVALLLTDS